MQTKCFPLNGAFHKAVLSVPALEASIFRRTIISTNNGLYSITGSSHNGLEMHFLPARGKGGHYRSMESMSVSGSLSQNGR